MHKSTLVDPDLVSTRVSLASIYCPHTYNKKIRKIRWPNLKTDISLNFSKTDIYLHNLQCNKTHTFQLWAKKYCHHSLVFVRSRKPFTKENGRGMVVTVNVKTLIDSVLKWNTTDMFDFSQMTSSKQHKNVQFQINLSNKK